MQEEEEREEEEEEITQSARAEGKMQTKCVSLDDMIKFFSRQRHARMLLQCDESFAIVFVDPHTSPRCEETLFVQFFTFPEDLQQSLFDGIPLKEAEIDGWKLILAQ